MPHIFTTDNVIIFISTIITFWVFNNKALRDGLTQWFIDRKLKNRNDIERHHVKTALESVKFKSRHIVYDNELKTELFQLYVSTFIDNMAEYVDTIIDKYNGLDFIETKKLVTEEMYKTLTKINYELELKVKMPEKLQLTFEKFSNYLAIHHSNEIDNTLSAISKEILINQVFNTVASNSSWFLFYSTAMFDNFNGAFNTLTHKDVFKS
jgi:hypothetical protein